MTRENLPPNPEVLWQALSAIGYSFEAAIADLVDNSIAAGARNVSIYCHWIGSESWCAVSDDGCGMDEDQLREAVRIASSSAFRDRVGDDLGKFGMGLKTASFSQCDRMTVASRTTSAGPISIFGWDRDHVKGAAPGEWPAERLATRSAQSVIEKCLGEYRGTVVVWEKLRSELVPANTPVDDELAHSRFRAIITLLASELGVIFGEFIHDFNSPLNISVNENPIRGWEPFLINHPKTQLRPTETLDIHGNKVVVSPYILPHQNYLSPEQANEAMGPNGWIFSQGFYVYRMKRLIKYGTWFFRGMSSDMDNSLGRIRIEIDSGSDEQWNLNVAKSSVEPPHSVKRDLKRIAKDVRAKSKLVHRHRAVAVAPRKPRRGIETLVIQHQLNGKLVYKISRKHPLVAHLAQCSDAAAVNAVLDAIESSISFMIGDRDPFARSTDLQMIATVEIENSARWVLERFVSIGMERADAVEKLQFLDPFAVYPSLIEKLRREL